MHFTYRPDVPYLSRTSCPVCFGSHVCFSFCLNKRCSFLEFSNPQLIPGLCPLNVINTVNFICMNISLHCVYEGGAYLTKALHLQDKVEYNILGSNTEYSLLLNWVCVSYVDWAVL